MRALVEHRRADDPTPDDPFRGLYLTDDASTGCSPPRHRATARRRRAARRRAGLRRGRGGRVRRPGSGRSQRACGLSDLDVELLLVALVPDLDSRFERLYGYLNDDVTRRRATIGLALGWPARRRPPPPARARLPPARR